MLVYKEHITLRGEITPEIVSKLIHKHTAGRSRFPNARFYLTEVKPGELVLCQAAEPDVDPETSVRAYLEKLGAPCGKISCEQIGVAEFASAIHHGSEEELCPDVPDVLGPLHMMPFVAGPFSSWIDEATFTAKRAPAKVRQCCTRLHSRSLSEEVERVFAGEGQPFRGHPVLYGIITGSHNKNEAFTELLLPLLHLSGRMPATRVCVLKPDEHPYPEYVLNDVYAAQGGAAVIVDFRTVEDGAEGDEAFRAIARLAREHRDTVLTVFRAAADDEAAVKHLKEITSGLPLLPLTEDPLTPAEAKRELSAMAKDAGLGRVSFAGKLPKDKTSFTEREVEGFFHRWHDEYLTTDAYPQYAGILRPEAPEKVSVSAPSSAMEELERMIGLAEVKQIIRQAVDYARMQALCREHGLPAEPPHLHMVFTGNPGTAKTTVARLVARIFRECGVLSKGELVEVGRGDLIGKYVGWTARLVQEKFRAAEGSVLFIDEAYSLLDDKENQFGDEAINAIVQEMENRRDSTVVIFAGYREPMQRFLDRNAGLRSRVSYQINFPDYTEEELMQIMQLQLAEKARKLSPEAEDKVRALLHCGATDAHRGNGRYARSLVENAMLAQASRVAALPGEQITRETLTCLRAEDFREKTQEEKPQTRPIGFCA